MAGKSLSRRQFLNMSGAALGVAALAACVPAAPAPAPSSPADDAGPSGETVVSDNSPLWVVHSNDFHPDYNTLVRATIEGYAAEKGWPLEVANMEAFLGGSPAIQRLAASVQAGDAPDLWMHNVNVFQLNQLGTLNPVDDIVEEAISRYGAIAPRPFRETQVDGSFMAVPFHVRSDGGWARKDVFDAKGIDVTALETFDELRDACMEVSDPAAEMWGWGLTVNRGGDGGWLTTRVLHGWGATWVDETGDYVTIDSPEAVEAVEWLVDIYTNPQWERMLPPGVLSWTDTSNNEAYLGGKIAYTFNAGTVYAKAVVDENPVADVTIFDVPKGGPVLKRFNGLNSQNWLMIKEGKNPAAAKELVLHFLSDDILRQVYQVATAYALPAYESMWEWDEIASVPISLAQKEVALDPTGWNALAYPGPTTAQIGAVGNANIHTDMIASVLNGQATPAEAVAQAAQRSIEIFQEFGAPGER